MALSGSSASTLVQSEVLHLVATGRSVKGIALDLDLGIDTVKNHLAEAYRLLGAHNRVEAILRSGLMVGVAVPRATGEAPRRQRSNARFGHQ